MALLPREMSYSKFHRWTLLPCTLSSWLCFQLLVHLLFIQSGMLVLVMGLRLESISVPQSGIKGNSVMLGCEFRLDDEGEKLYSLKWYKDNHEFFRYMPQGGANPIRTFSRPGVLVDSTENRPLGANRVVFKLKNLRLSSGGTYKCEISADAPTFKTLSKESNLSVIVLPDPPVPRLKGFPPHGQLGDRVRGNCSFSKSYPPAKLTFYVNGAKVNNSEEMRVKMYEPRVDGVIDDYSLSGGSSSSTSMIAGSSNSNGVSRQYQYHQQQQQQQQQTSSSSLSSSSSSYPGMDGLNNGELLGGVVGGANSMIAVTEKTYTSVTGIEFRLDRHHFRGRGQVLNIRCVASVVDQMWDAQTNITQSSYQSPQLSTAGQNQYLSGSEYLVPIFSFVNISFLSETVRMGILVGFWTFLLC